MNTSTHDFIPALRPGQSRADSPAIAFTADGELLVHRHADTVTLPQLRDFAGLPPAPERFDIGALDGIPCETWSDAVCPGELTPLNLREALRLLPPPWYNPVSRAAELLAWHHRTRCCGRCGAPSPLHDHGEPAKYCPACGLLVYPTLSPAVITAVTKGEEILLANNHKFRPGLYSIIAGFVETGESLEDAVQREIREETGIAVTDIRYFGSQSWPFPGSLMIGFTAEYAGGEIVPDGKEILDARWFDRRHLPPLPSPPSIAHKIIQAVINRENH
ncbi:MAG: NAD(+) diphosphatase [Victivallales bacterium]|nr:NAD(+) diphosphatase [Victivallales bacterium]